LKKSPQQEQEQQEDE